MFASQLGIRLILWIGATVPTPAPYEVMTNKAACPAHERQPSVI